MQSVQALTFLNVSSLLDGADVEGLCGGGGAAGGCAAAAAADAACDLARANCCRRLSHSASALQK